MATKKTTATVEEPKTEEAVEVVEEVKETKTENPEKTNWKEKVPYTIPLDRNDNSDVFVSVNGRSYNIQRGVEVMLPRNVAKVLDDSRKAEYEAYMRSRKLEADFQSGLAKLK